jgi:2,4-diaminopentanoate dehydrogenase
MLRVIQVGLGPLGRKMVQFIAERPRVKVVAAVDPAGGIAGRGLAELCELGGAAADSVAGVVVSADLPAALVAAASFGGADVAVLTTNSAVARVQHQIAELAAARLPIVSTCEELSYPWVAHCEEAAFIDEVCKEHGVACLGTGVNPGFLMDFLPAALTGLCKNVRAVTVRRIQDAAPRRVPFQQKIGAGLTPAAFREKVAEGSLRHVGLPESVHLLAAACGWELSRVEETIEPVMAEAEITGGYRPIAPGQAAGVEQWGRGFVAEPGGEVTGASREREVVTMQFRAAVDQPDPRDEVEIEGTPPIRSVIAGGVNGDIATCAVVLNMAPVVAVAPPGLHTMLDLPPATVGR